MMLTLVYMPNPIYYYELDLEVNLSKSNLYKKTWFISKVSENGLKTHLESHTKDFNRLLYIAFKKKAKALRDKKIKSFNINITLCKHVGYSNN